MCAKVGNNSPSFFRHFSVTSGPTQLSHLGSDVVVRDSFTRSGDRDVDMDRMEPPARLRLGARRVLGRSPPSVLDGIQLSGPPWSLAGFSSTMFGLAPHGSAVSSLFPPTSGSPHHRLWRGGSRFCSVASRLRLRLAAPCVLLRGRNFPRRPPWPVRRLASWKKRTSYD
jgi:hypothetical protein